MQSKNTLEKRTHLCQGSERACKAHEGKKCCECWSTTAQECSALGSSTQRASWTLPLLPELRHWESKTHSTSLDRSNIHSLQTCSQRSSITQYPFRMQCTVQCSTALITEQSSAIKTELALPGNSSGTQNVLSFRLSRVIQNKPHRSKCTWATKYIHTCKARVCCKCSAYSKTHCSHLPNSAETVSQCKEHKPSLGSGCKYSEHCTALSGTANSTIALQCSKTANAVSATHVDGTACKNGTNPEGTFTVSLGFTITWDETTKHITATPEM